MRERSEVCEKLHTVTAADAFRMELNTVMRHALMCQSHQHPLLGISHFFTLYCVTSATCPGNWQQTRWQRASFYCQRVIPDDFVFGTGRNCMKQRVSVVSDAREPSVDRRYATDLRSIYHSQNLMSKTDAQNRQMRKCTHNLRTDS